jgi:hypothetical protein
MTHLIKQRSMAITSRVTHALLFPHPDGEALHVAFFPPARAPITHTHIRDANLCVKKQQEKSKERAPAGMNWRPAREMSELSVCLCLLVERALEGFQLRGEGA